MSAERQDTSYSPKFFSEFISAQPTEEIKRLALGVDFDGCTDRYVARARLSDEVANFVLDHPDIEEIDVIISSLRQTFLLDYSNAYANPVDEFDRRQSCTALTEELLSDIEWKIALLFEKNSIKRPVPTIRFQPLLLSDIYYGLPYGTTFATMQATQHYTQMPDNFQGFVTVSNLEGVPAYLAYYDAVSQAFVDVLYRATPGFEFADNSKFLTLWVQIQYFAQEVYGPGQPFVFRWVDDNPAIIAAVTEFFHASPHLVPQNCSLEILYMSSNYEHYPPETKPPKIVTGVGETQKDYRTKCSNIALQVQSNCHPQDLDSKAKLIQELLLTHHPLKDEMSNSPIMSY